MAEFIRRLNTEVSLSRTMFFRRLVSSTGDGKVFHLTYSPDNDIGSFRNNAFDSSFWVRYEGEGYSSLIDLLSDTLLGEFSLVTNNFQFQSPNKGNFKLNSSSPLIGRGRPSIVFAKFQPVLWIKYFKRF